MAGGLGAQPQLAVTAGPLARLARARLDSLKTHDQREFPPSSVADPAHWPPSPPSLAFALRRHGARWPRVLAEVKRASPSAGALSAKPAVELCREFVEAGVHGVSVLADPLHFAGHPRDLLACRRAFPELPLLFKDFVQTPYQVQLARAVGASAVLLMTQLLRRAKLEELYALALGLGLEPFVEVHDEAELESALALHPPLIGINARDFKREGLPLDLGTAAKLLQDLIARGGMPENTVIVAQSGISGPADLEELARSCPPLLPDAVQIGTSLARGDAAWLKPYLS